MTGRARAFLVRASADGAVLRRFSFSIGCRERDRGFFGTGPASSAEESGRELRDVAACGARELRRG